MINPLNILIICSREDYSDAQDIKKHLQNYRIPKYLIGENNRDGKVVEKINHIYINLDNNLTTESEELNANYAVVLCSPAAVASTDVDKSLKLFKQKHGSNRVLCYILSGEPNASDNPKSGLEEAFPQSVRFHVNGAGGITSERTEPIAADSRKQGDGVKNAKLKLIAGVFGVRYSALQQRAKKRKHQQQAVIITALMLVLIFLANIFLAQSREEHLQRQTEYEAAANQAFSGFNNQSPDSIALIHKTQSLYDDSLDDKNLLSDLDFRWSHIKLPSITLNPSVQPQFLLSDNSHEAVYGVSLSNGVLNFTEKDNQLASFNLPDANWSHYSNHKKQILAIEIVDQSLAWVILGTPHIWQALKLNLKDQSISMGKLQNKTLLENIEYPGRHTGFRRNLNLINGQLIFAIKDSQQGDKVGIYDANTDTSYVTDFPSSINWKDIPYEISLNLHRKSQSLFITHTQQGVYHWPYTTDTAFNSQLYTGTLKTSLLNAAGDWLVINKTSKTFDHSSELLHIESKKRFILSDLHISHVLQQSPNILHLLTGPEIDAKGEAFINIDTGKVYGQRLIDWNFGISEKDKNTYYIKYKNLYRQAQNHTETLKQWTIDCDEHSIILKNSTIHCFINNKWIMYLPEDISKQQAKTLDGYIVDYHQSKQGDFWVISNSNSAHLSILKSEAGSLNTKSKMNNSHACNLKLTPVDNSFSYITYSLPGSSFFGNGPCTIQQPIESDALHLDTNSQLKNTSQISNMSIASAKGVTHPNFSIDGIHNDLSDLNWYAHDNQMYYHNTPLNNLKTKNNDLLFRFYYSHNKKRKVLAVTELNQQEDSQGIMSIDIWDETGNKKIRTITSQKVTQQNFEQHIYIHGFSPNGDLFWWAKLGEDVKMNWVALDKQTLVDNLPTHFNSLLDYLVFSQSNNFLMLASPFVTGTHKVIDLQTGKVVFDASVPDSEWAANRTRIDFHKQLPWMIFNGDAIALHKTHPVSKINYTGKVSLLDFHKEKPWAAGICVDKFVCIANLQNGQIIFHLRLPNILYSLEKNPLQVRFTDDGKNLSYTLAGRTLVIHDLML